MDNEKILSEVTQTQKNKYSIHLLISVYLLLSVYKLLSIAPERLYKEE